MTALYFETDDEQQLDNAIFDGYPDRLLEDVKFIVRIVGGRLKASIQPDDAQYFSTLNAKLWLEKVENYIQDYDVFTHPENGEDVYLVTDEPTEPVVGVVGKAYTWEEVLQKAKVKELSHTEPTKPVSREQSIGRTQRGMTEELAQDPTNPPVDAL